MYNFTERLQQIFTLDIIRICKIGEIFQYSLVFLFLLVGFFYILEKYYYPLYDKNKKEQLSLFYLFIDVFFDTFLIIIAFFYLRKIALLMPSIPNLLYPKFNALTTLDYSIHIALVVVFIELLPEYKDKIKKLGERLRNNTKID